MLIDLSVCYKCQETIHEIGPYYMCANCKSDFCEDCYPKQKRKYRLSTEENKEHYGSDVLKECDNCSKKY